MVPNAGIGRKIGKKSCVYKNIVGEASLFYSNLELYLTERKFNAFPGIINRIEVIPQHNFFNIRQ